MEDRIETAKEEHGLFQEVFSPWRWMEEGFHIFRHSWFSWMVLWGLGWFLASLGWWFFFLWPCLVCGYIQGAHELAEGRRAPDALDILGLASHLGPCLLLAVVFGAIAWLLWWALGGALSAMPLHWPYPGSEEMVFELPPSLRVAWNFLGKAGVLLFLWSLFWPLFPLAAIEGYSLTQGFSRFFSAVASHPWGYALLSLGIMFSCVFGFSFFLLMIAGKRGILPALAILGIAIASPFVLPALAEAVYLMLCFFSLIFGFPLVFPSIYFAWRDLFPEKKME